MTSGLASWLRSMVWEVVPAIPKAIPDSSPMTALGSRTSPTSKEAPGTVSPAITRRTSPTVWWVPPVMTVVHHRAAARAARTSVTAQNRRVRRRRPGTVKPGSGPEVPAVLVVPAVVLVVPAAPTALAAPAVPGVLFPVLTVLFTAHAPLRRGRS